MGSPRHLQTPDAAGPRARNSRRRDSKPWQQLKPLKSAKLHIMISSIFIKKIFSLLLKKRSNILIPTRPEPVHAATDCPGLSGLRFYGHVVRDVDGDGRCRPADQRQRFKRGEVVAVRGVPILPQWAATSRFSRSSAKVSYITSAHDTPSHATTTGSTTSRSITVGPGPPTPPKDLGLTPDRFPNRRVGRNPARQAARGSEFTEAAPEFLDQGRHVIRRVEQPVVRPWLCAPP